MQPFTYHSPEGNRTLFAKKSPADGRVDLHGEDGELEIGNCEVADRVGGCSPTGSEDADSDDSPKKKK